MMTIIEGLPPGSVGVEVHDEITTSDYTDVLVPAVEAARAASSDGKVRLLYVLGRDMPDVSAGAAWQDTKLGLGHLRSWQRIAIVSDSEWLDRSIRALGWMMPGEVRVFAYEKRDEARAWLAT